MKALEFEIWLPTSIETAFERIGDVGSLDRVTPPWFRLVPVSDDRRTLAVGSRVDYRLRWRGLPMRWQSVIRCWERPTAIAYEQARGPFRSFRHEHHFEPSAAGTRVVDRVVFDCPGGVLVSRLIVEPDLKRIFEFRRRELLDRA